MLDVKMIPANVFLKYLFQQVFTTKNKMLYFIAEFKVYYDNIFT